MSDQPLQPPACKECGEPCIDAGPGLGWQCVSDKPHSPLAAFVDPQSQRLADLEREVSRLQGALANNFCDLREEVLTLTTQLAQARACPRPLFMGEHACTNRKQCWEPCGDLGKHGEYQAGAS